MLLPALKDAFAQVSAACAVTFVAFLISRRSVRGFGEWLGVKAPTERSVRLALVLVVPMFGLAVLINRLPALQPFFEKATGFNAIIRDAGLPLGPTLAVALVHGLIQTGLSEEILFRGLLGHGLAQPGRTSSSRRGRGRGLNARERCAHRRGYAVVTSDFDDLDRLRAHFPWRAPPARLPTSRRRARSSGSGAAPTLPKDSSSDGAYSESRPG